MSGQRSNQYKVDPGEFSAPTDENPADAHLHDAAKMQVKQTQADERESLIPRRGENPALAELKARREAAAAAGTAGAAQGRDRHVEVRDADERALDAEKTE